MATYVELVKKARQMTLKLTQQQQEEILNVYKDTFSNLSELAARAKKGSLTERWLKDYMVQVEEEGKRLADALYGSIRKGVAQAGKNAVLPDLALFKAAQAKAGIDLGPHFTEMFSQVPTEALAAIIRGDIYKDGKGLSVRIWNVVDDFRRDIGYIIRRAIAEKKSAIQLARDLETFVIPSAQRPWDWGTVYPNLRTKDIDYNAQRLARTCITHAHRESQYRSAALNPFVDAIHWELSLEHYYRQVARWGEDECDEYAQQDSYGLGTGNFPVDEVPLSHPQCLCFTYPVITKSLDGIVDELLAWEEGLNPELETWFENIRDRGARAQLLETIKGQAWYGQIKKDDRAAVFAYIEKATDEELRILETFGDLIKGDFYAPGTGYYSPADRSVYLDLADIDDKTKSAGEKKVNITTFFHEIGHLIDFNTGLKVKGHGPVSMELDKIRDYLEKDFLAYANRLVKKEVQELMPGAGLEAQEKVFQKMKIMGLDKIPPEWERKLIKDLFEDANLKSSLSDIVEGLTDCRVHGRWGHGLNYWRRYKALEGETVAHVYEAKMVKGERLEVFKEYFPETYKYIADYLDGLPGRV